jgi:hypothetical protein
MDGVNRDLVLKASFVGIVLLVLFHLISLAMGFWAMQTLFTVLLDLNSPFVERPLPSGDSILLPNFGFSLLDMAVRMGLSMLLSCLTWVVPGLMAGGFYAVWHNRQPVVKPGAIRGGLFSGVVASGVGGFVSGIVGLVIMIPMQQQFIQGISRSFGESSPPVIFPAGAILASGFISLLVNLVYWVVIGAATGALGGLAGDLLFRPKVAQGRQPVLDGTSIEQSSQTEPG